MAAPPVAGGLRADLAARAAAIRADIDRAYAWLDRARRAAVDRQRAADGPADSQPEEVA